MILEIVSPEAKLFSGEVTSVTLPGIAGSFQILNHHAPIVSIEDTIKGFNMILNGEVDQYPEAAFNLVGTIEDAIEKGKKILAEAK